MSAAPRLRGFRRLALGAVFLASLVVVLGAWVRLTAAGLGCPDWPGCYGHVFPEEALGSGFARALHEMLHRYVASSLGLLIVLLFALSVRARHEAGQPRLVPALLLLLVCLQGALGALTVTLRLTPLVVTAHLLGGLGTLALLRWLSIEPSADAATPRALRAFALGAGALLLVQLALGGWTSSNYAALACGELPTCQQAWWPPMDFKAGFAPWQAGSVDYEGGVLPMSARVAIQVTHRLGAVVTATALLSLAALAARRAPSRRARRAAAGLALAVLLQCALGLLTVGMGVPLSLATLHTAGAALLVLMMVTLLRALWPRRPPSSVLGFSDALPER